MEAVVRLQRVIAEEKLDWKVDFLPEPVSWTQVPMSWSSLGRQRERWQRGLMQVGLGKLGLFLNPRYGVVGLVGFPYVVIFEMLSAAVEFLSYPFTLLALSVGAVDATYAALFLGLVFFWGLFISFGTILMHEDLRHRYSSPRDLARLFGAALAENFGFRQVHSFWRLWGTCKFICWPRARNTGLSAWSGIARASFTE